MNKIKSYDEFINELSKTIDEFKKTKKINKKEEISEED